MKRLFLAVPAAVLSMVLLAAPALAQYPPSPAAGGGGTGTDPSGASGGTAFTGASLSLGLLIVAGLLVVGVAALLLSRRRQPAK